MDQEKIIDQFEEAILDRLPAEAIQKLADLTDLGGDHTEEAQAILDEYGIDAEALAKSLFMERSKGE